MTSAFGQSYLRLFWCALVMLLPRRLKVLALNLVPGFRVDPTSSIGFSFLCPARKLVLGPNTVVGHLTFCRGLERLELHSGSRIGNLNWLTGSPRGRQDDPFLATSPSRVPELLLAEHAVITHRHYLDCTDSIRIGAGSGILGFRTLVLTHSVELSSAQQGCKPIRIGRYCLVATNSVILGGAVLPDCCALGALSMLRDAHTRQYTLYSGNPASAVRDLDPTDAFFCRPESQADGSKGDPRVQSS